MSGNWKMFRCMVYMLIVLASLAKAASAQIPGGSPQADLYCYTGSLWAPCTNSNPLSISGSITASLGAWQPNGNYATLSVTTSTGNVALPSGGGTAIVVYNTGSNTASVKLGPSNAVTATTSEDQIPAGCFSGYTVGSNTYLAAITASSSTTLVISGGSGLPATGCAVSLSGTNGAAGATGSSVPADASYNGLNIGGTLRGQTGVNPSGSIYSAQVSGAGTAGSADPNVMTVQGIASMTPMLVNPGTIATWGLAAIGGTTGSPTNALAAGCQYNNSSPTFTSGDVGGIQCTSAGSIHMTVDNANANGQATMANSSPVVIASNQSAVSVVGSYAAGSTTSGQAGILGQCATTTSAPTNTTAQTNFLSCDTAGDLRVVAPSLAQGSSTSGQTGSLIMGAVLTAAPSYTSTQTSPLSLDPFGSLRVVHEGTTYNTIAASQTTQALTGGSGGASGDYLSHCTVIPTSTSPGVVTILDNATTIYAFPGGSSSTSNLVPFTIPVGAKSTSGAWKVTTGANLSAVCVGKFT